MIVFQDFYFLHFSLLYIWKYFHIWHKNPILVYSLYGEDKHFIKLYMYKHTFLISSVEKEAKFKFPY